MDMIHCLIYLNLQIVIHLKDFLGGIQHFVTVVGKWIFDSNFNFALPLTSNELCYCCTTDNETKLMNGNKVVWKSNRFLLTEKKSLIQK